MNEIDAQMVPVPLGPVERMVGPRLTRWFSHAEKPARAGVYRMQDRTMNCGCCWFMSHWNGREWHTDQVRRGLFNVLLFDSQVKRWRGLDRAKVGETR